MVTVIGPAFLPSTSRQLPGPAWFSFPAPVVFPCLLASISLCPPYNVFRSFPIMYRPGGLSNRCPSRMLLSLGFIYSHRTHHCLLICFYVFCIRLNLFPSCFLHFNFCPFVSSSNVANRCLLVMNGTTRSFPAGHVRIHHASTPTTVRYLPDSTTSHTIDFPYFQFRPRFDFTKLSKLRTNKRVVACLFLPSRLSPLGGWL